MIRSVVFDMGRVLIGFDPPAYLAAVSSDAADRALLQRAVFSSVEWAQMDLGVKTDEEALAAMCTHLPARLHTAARRLVMEWDQPLVPVPGMAALIAELKARGCGIYLLSNASLRQKEYWPRIPGSALFDGRVVSAECGLVKPQPEIYRLLLASCRLRAEECVFVDDMPLNAAAACTVGMQGFVFHGDTAELRAYLAAQGVL